MRVVAGIDEVGRGCVVGPMIFCMVYNTSCHVETIENLRRIGVRDSKDIKSPERMAELARKIEGIVGVSYKIAEPSLIDEFVSVNKFNELSVRLVSDLLANSKVELNEVIVDSLGNSPRYQSELSRNFPNYGVTLVEKAEGVSPYCAAASICAKDYRNRLIEQINQTYRVGSGYPSDPLTKEFIMSNLTRIKRREFTFLRYSWGTIKRLL